MTPFRASRRPPCKNESRHDGFQNRNLYFPGGHFQAIHVKRWYKVCWWMTGGWLNLNMVQILSSPELLRWAFFSWTLWDSYPPIIQKEVHWIFTMPRSSKVYMKPWKGSRSISKPTEKAFKTDIDTMDSEHQKIWEVAKWAVPFFFRTLYRLTIKGHELCIATEGAIKKPWLASS